MDFTDLSRLWLLALLPVLYWLARPPRPRRRVATAHLAQWRAALARVARAPVRFRRWRFWLLALAAAALVLASTAPRIGARPGPSRLVVLLDETASMGAEGGWPSARRAFESLLATTPAEIEVHVLAVGDAVRSLGSAVTEAERSELSARWPAAPRPVGAIVAPGHDLAAIANAIVDNARAQPHDGDFGDPVALATITDARGPRMRVPTIGALFVVGDATRAPSNAAIVDCQIRDEWPLPGATVTCEVFAAPRPTTPLTLRCEPATGRPFEIRVDIAADGYGRAQFELDTDAREGPTSRAFRVRLASGDDAMQCDDFVELRLPAVPTPDVVALGGGAETGLWVDDVAALLAHASSGRVVPPERAERAGFVVVEGGTLAELPARGIVFGAAVGVVDPAVERMPKLVDPVLRDWDRVDPLMAGIDWSELRVREALDPRALPSPGEGVRELLRGERGPLAVAIDRADGARTVCFAFRLTDSNLPLLAALPQFCARAYRAAFGSAATPQLLGHPLLDPAESDLRPVADVRARPLDTDAFGREGHSLVIPLLVLALVALALRTLT